MTLIRTSEPEFATERLEVKDSGASWHQARQTTTETVDTTGKSELRIDITGMLHVFACPFDMGLGW